MTDFLILTYVDWMGFSNNNCCIYIGISCRSV